jgi:hypothetical protein
MPAESLKALLTQLVDYAGLFPPAKLGMEEAVRAYAAHRQSPHAWAMSRFIVPATRLEEFSKASLPFMPRLPEGEQSPPEPWPLSVLIDGKLDESVARIERFNAEHESNGHGHKHAHNAVVDTVEIKVQTPDTIDLAMEILPEELYPFFEIPIDGDFRGFATALAGTGNGAKVRTGGVVAEAFPPVERIADFLIAMHAAEVPFKATAGLHHPVRSSQPMTYEPGAACTTMNGFVNLFAAATMLHGLRIKRDTLLAVLNENNPDAFRFTDDAMYWRELKLGAKELFYARENFAICFGSCSFDDPMNDLKKLGWM